MRASHPPPYDLSHMFQILQHEWKPIHEETLKGCFCPWGRIAWTAVQPTVVSRTSDRSHFWLCKTSLFHKVRNAIIIRKLYLYGTDFSSWICLKSIVKRMKLNYDWLTLTFFVSLWFTKWPLNSWVVYFMLGISPESVVHQFQWHNAKWWIL